VFCHEILRDGQVVRLSPVYPVRFDLDDVMNMFDHMDGENEYYEAHLMEFPPLVRYYGPNNYPGHLNATLPVPGQLDLPRWRDACYQELQSNQLREVFPVLARPKGRAPIAVDIVRGPVTQLPNVVPQRNMFEDTCFRRARDSGYPVICSDFLERPQHFFQPTPPER
jgi:hypothetical protein